MLTSRTSTSCGCDMWIAMFFASYCNPLGWTIALEHRTNNQNLRTPNYVTTFFETWSPTNMSSIVTRNEERRLLFVVYPSFHPFTSVEIQIQMRSMAFVPGLLDLHILPTQPKSLTHLPPQSPSHATALALCPPRCPPPLPRPRRCQHHYCCWARPTQPAHHRPWSG